jgi:small subunit ribosomal protein S3
MGHKTHPIGARLGYIKDWQALWVAPRNSSFASQLQEDLIIRKKIKERYPMGRIGAVKIERFGDSRIRITIKTTRPGLIIGRQGQEIEALRLELHKFTKKDIQIEVENIEDIQLCAALLAEFVAGQIERRIPFRRAMKMGLALARRAGAKGIKIAVKGRLGGAEIARCEWYREGRLPLQTFRADIDYGFTEAITKYGRIGVKVWLFKGEILPGGVEYKKIPEITPTEGEMQEEVLEEVGEDKIQLEE